MNESEPAVLRTLPIVSQGETAPGANAILHHWVMTTTVIHDLALEDGVSIVSLNVGQREIARAEGQTWGEAIRGVVAAPKTSITIVAKNDSEIARTLRATLQLEEQAEVIASAPSRAAGPAVQRQFGTAPRAVVNAGTPPRADGSPFVRATGARVNSPAPVPSVQSAPAAVAAQTDGAPKRNVVRTKLAPLSERDPNVAPTPRSARGAMNGGSRMRPNGRVGARINPPRVVAAAADGQTAMVRSATVRTVFQRGAPPRVMASGGGLTQTRATVASAPRRTQEVVPNAGERAIVILHGHVERLLLRVEKHVTLPKTFKPALVRALNQALGYDGPRTAGGNDVVVCLSPEDIQGLMQVVHYGGLMLSEPQRTRVANALRLGLAIARSNSQSSDQAAAEVVPTLAVVPASIEDETESAAESG